jgi:Ran GTPase-activating protein (RanGAP) involved in mRNA processing and transport
MDLLSEEVGLVALDLQDNGITLKGAEMALSMLELNKEIQILDIRNNEFGNFVCISC